MNSSLSWEKETLLNGLRVLKYQRPAAMTAQLSVAVEYGSIDDANDKAGCAHLLEHMLVGGSQKRVRLHHEIEKFGGCSSFETTPECTFVSVDVFPKKIVEASKVLAELLFDLEFEKDKLELEKKVIRNEIAEAADDPRDKIGETLMKCLFKYHPVRNPISGTRNTVSRLTLKDIERSHLDFYVPKNMIVIFTGNYKENDVPAVLENFQVEEAVSSGFRRKCCKKEGDPKNKKVLEKRGISQAYLSFGLRTIPVTDPEMPSLDLIDALMGTGESSRLFIELREKRALTYDFASLNVSGSDYGYFTVNCAIKSKLSTRVQTIIQGEFEKLKTKAITLSELEKSKNLLVGNIFRAFDDSLELPRILADVEIHFRNEKALQTYINKISQLTAQDIRKTANKYFQEENYATAILIPKKK